MAQQVKAFAAKPDESVTRIQLQMEGEKPLLQADL